MLTAAAMFHPKTISRARIAALSGLSSTSGSFGTYLSALRTEGFLTGGPDTFSITEAGINKVGEFEPLPTDPQVLIDMWCNNVGNSSGASRILREVGAIYPHSLSKQEVGERIGMSYTSGSFGTYLSQLRSRGLITVQNGEVKAADELFGN